MVSGISGAFDQGVRGVFQGRSNETIGGRVRLRRPELSLIKLKVVLAASEDLWIVN
jgi:hypothetical protein